jgi:hypothetical protein
VGKHDAGKLMSVYSHRNLNVPVWLDKQQQQKRKIIMLIIIIITTIIIIIKGRTKERVISNQSNPLSSSDAYSLLVWRIKLC